MHVVVNVYIDARAGAKKVTYIHKYIIYIHTYISKINKSQPDSTPS